MKSKKSSARKGKKVNGDGDFVHCTVSIPRELFPFVKQRCNEPLHAGSRSSYMRWLILADVRRAKKELEVAA